MQKNASRLGINLLRGTAEELRRVLINKLWWIRNWFYENHDVLNKVCHLTPLGWVRWDSKLCSLPLSISADRGKTLETFKQGSAKYIWLCCQITLVHDFLSEKRVRRINTFITDRTEHTSAEKWWMYLLPTIHLAFNTETCHCYLKSSIV